MNPDHLDLLAYSCLIALAFALGVFIVKIGRGK